MAPFSFATWASAPPAQASRPDGERIERDERDPFACAVIEHLLRAAVGDAVAVLNGHDRDKVPRSLQELDIDVGETHVTHLAFAAQACQLACRLLDRDLGVQSV